MSWKEVSGSLDQVAESAAIAVVVFVLITFLAVVVAAVVAVAVAVTVVRAPELVPVIVQCASKPIAVVHEQLFARFDVSRREVRQVQRSVRICSDFSDCECRELLSQLKRPRVPVQPLQSQVGLLRSAIVHRAHATERKQSHV